MLAMLFARTRAGISHIKSGISYLKSGYTTVTNYLRRKPYGKPLEFSNDPLYHETAIREWGVPELNSNDPRVRQNLHHKAMENLFGGQPSEERPNYVPGSQPVDRAEFVIKQHLKTLGLKEKGSSFLAQKFMEESPEAMREIYTSPAMTALVVQYSKPGLVKKRAYTNSILALVGSEKRPPITAGNILYSELKNHSLYGERRLKALFKEARQMDAAAQAPVPQPAAPEGGLIGSKDLPDEGIPTQKLPIINKGDVKSGSLLPKRYLLNNGPVKPEGNALSRSHFEAVIADANVRRQLASVRGETGFLLDPLVRSHVNDVPVSRKLVYGSMPAYPGDISRAMRAWNSYGLSQEDNAVRAFLRKQGVKESELDYHEAKVVELAKSYKNPTDFIRSAIAHLRKSEVSNPGLTVYARGDLNKRKKQEIVSLFNHARAR